MAERIVEMMQAALENQTTRRRLLTGAAGLVGGAFAADRLGFFKSEVAYAYHTIDARDGQGITYSRAHRFPDNPEPHAPEGVISNSYNRGKGLETWMGSNGRDLSSLSQVSLESLSRDGDAYILPPNQMVTLIDSGGEKVGPQTYTRPQRLKIEAGHVLFISAGEGHIDAKSPNVDVSLDLIQIDGNLSKGEAANPHNNHVYLFSYIDPDITLSRFVSGHAIAIMQQMEGAQIVAEEAVYRRRGLSRNWRTTAEHYVDLRGGRYGAWIGGKGSNNLDLMIKNY